MKKAFFPLSSSDNIVINNFSLNNKKKLIKNSQRLKTQTRKKWTLNFPNETNYNYWLHIPTTYIYCVFSMPTFNLDKENLYYELFNEKKKTTQ